MRKHVFGVSDNPIRSDTNQSVQLQKRVRGLKFGTVGFRKKRGLYYLRSENEGGSHVVDLRICFSKCKKKILS